MTSTFIYLKNSAYLLGVLLLVACQPPAPTDKRHVTEDRELPDTPLIISSDSITMTRDYILNIKPSRYQPSLGLQGNIEPIKQTRFIAAHALIVEQILVTKGQWVEAGTPLFIIRRLTAPDQQITTTNLNVSESSASKKLSSTEQDNKTLSSTEPDITANAAEADTLDHPVSNKTDVGNNSAASTSAANSSSNTNTDNNKNKDTLTPEKKTQLITVRASFSGRVDNLYAQVGEQIAVGMPLLHLSDDTDLRFIATLPIQAEPQLSVGQNVNFTTKGMIDKFTGQVSQLIPSAQPDQLLVYVHVINNEVSRGKLVPKMLATGRVDYGQIEVGTIVPENALHDVDLTTIQTPPYQSLAPLTANVWTIKQDQRLTRQPVEVINYDPSTKQYLIAGISNDSLICLADLPVESAGKKVVVS